MLICEFNMRTFVFETMSASSYKILGYEPSEMVGKTIEPFVHPEYLEKSLLEAKNNILDDKDPPRLFYNVYLKKDGTPQPLLWISNDVTKEHAICVAIPLNIQVYNRIKL